MRQTIDKYGWTTLKMDYNEESKRSAINRRNVKSYSIVDFDTENQAGRIFFSMEFVIPCKMHGNNFLSVLHSLFKKYIISGMSI